MKKKLLFISNTMMRAGAETALIELLKRLDATENYDISLFSIIPCGEMFSQVPNNVQILNKHISESSNFTRHLWVMGTVIYSFFYKLNGFKMLGYMKNNIKEQKTSGRGIQYDKLLWRLMATGRSDLKGSYDLAVSYIEGAATYYVADKVKASRKAAFVHIDYQEAGYTRLMDQGCYDAMDKIFVVSNGVGEKFCNYYPQYSHKVKLFRNFLDKENILQKAKSGTGFIDQFDGIRLVTVGRLHYQKGYDIAIEVLAKMRGDGYNVRWYVIGEGMERRNLEILIKKYGVEEYFILMGAKNNPYPYIKQADIYVQATRFEGKSIAIEEAQILGKAIVASDCTGNTEQIQSGYDGMLLTLNVENLVQGLEKIIDEPELQEKYAENVLQKQLDFPEDLEFMLSMIKGDEKNE